MKLLCRGLTLAVTLLTANLLHVVTSVTLKCVKEKSKNCVIPSLVQDYPSADVYLPDLSKKGSLQITAGNLTNFSEKLSKQLGTVEKLVLGPMQLREIFLKPELLELTAAGNQIEAIKFRTVNAEYKVQLLDLRENRLRNLDGFEVLVELRELHLEGNALETVDLRVFNGMSNLKTLFLQRNQLTTVLATDTIDLPALEFFSLAGNKLTHLDVTNWLFESLMECDVSKNGLVYINGLENAFPSMHTINLAENWWHCSWLGDTLKHFTDHSVTIKDQAGSCEGKENINNICCVPVIDTQTKSADQLSSLKSMKKVQSELKEEIKRNIKTLEDEQKEMLTKLIKDLNDLERMANNLQPTSATDSVTKSEFVKLKSRAQALKASFKDNLDSWKKQDEHNQETKQRLQYTIVDLRRSLDREIKKINESKAQFDHIRSFVSSNLRKRN